MKMKKNNSTNILSRLVRFFLPIRRFLALLFLAGLTAALFVVIFINGCQNESPGILDVCVAPTVIRTSPADGETHVLFNTTSVAPFANVSAFKIISANLSTPMNTNSLSTTTFTVQQGSTFLLGTVTYTDTTALFIVPDGLSPNLTYTCTITTGAKDAAGIALANNYVWTFTTIAAQAPTLIVPLNSSINQTTNPTLIWNTVPGADFYRLQVSTRRDFVAAVYDDSVRTGTSQPIHNLAVGTTYYWRVNERISGGTSAYSSIWSFTTIAPPAAPVLVTPVNTAVNISTSPTLAWNAVPGAISYRLQISMDSTFISTIYDDSTRKSNSQQIAGLTNGTNYYWRVNAKNSGGTSAYSSIWSFTTIAPPVAPVLVAPVNTAVNIATSPTLIWNSVPEVNSYRLQISRNINFINMVYNDSTRTSTSQAMTGLTVGTTYYWRANAKNVVGTSAYSNVWSFTTIGLDTVTLSSTPFSGGTISGAGVFNFGSSVTVVAAANPGYTFTSWTEAGIAVSTNASYTFTIGANRTLVANYAINSYSLAITSANGTVAKTPSQASYNYGTSVTLTATPGTGYSFTSWSGDTTSAANPMTLTMTGNRNITANYAALQYTITLSSSPAYGTTSGGGTSSYGSSVTINATPTVTGSAFTRWTENGSTVSYNASYTFTISADRTLIAHFGQAQINLGTTANNFAVLAGAGVTDAGGSHVYGDVGSDPTPTINGLTAAQVSGILYTATDPVVQTAKNDLNAAYIDAQARSLDNIALAANLGGSTLAPGLYTNSSSSGISGSGSNAILTLDAGGDSNAVWIFQIGSTLVTDAGTSIVLANGAQWKNIYWSVGTSATLGTNSIFYGNILADQSITITTGAKLFGRALTRVAAVTMDTDIIDKR